MPLCLTYFSRGLDEPVLRNHSHYSRLYGYPHQWIEGWHISHYALRESYKYGQILRHLRSLPENDWLLFIDDDSVVAKPIDIERLMAGRDLLVVEGPPANGHPGKPMTNMMVIRNTPSNRALVHALIADAGNVIAQGRKEIDEADLLRAAGVLPCNAVLHDIHVNITWRISNWFLAPVFVVSLGPLPSVDADADQYRTLHDLRLQALLVKKVNASLMHGETLLAPANYPALSTDADTHLNPDAPIAFVTLYGHDIHSYARVSEHNVRRYCERHGHAYHVYRGIPKELDQGMNGTWVKTWVLQRHFAAHQWVIWVDADVLFTQQSRPVEPLLEGRDLLLAKDVGAWRINAGVLGFRNTPRNAELLAQIWDRITTVQDKTGVWTGQGDQFHINEVLHAHGLTGEENVYDNQTINTPPMLADADSYLVHFVNLGEPYRSVFMADMDAASQRAS
ncbi:MAG: galactosyl transferase GMA12/MNN10 family protein [Comamonadaceae bacterium]|nr:MAG: galactosyl transferase GMA12/MNN10 family protein [Comamonadaceae bacterium]